MIAFKKKISSAFSRITVEPLLFLYMFAGIMEMLTLQDLIYFRICTRTFNDTVCTSLNAPENREQLGAVQKTAANWTVFAVILTFIPSFLMSNFYASWSDRYGRKFPILLPAIGNVPELLIFLSIALSPLVPLELVFLKCLISGFLGGHIVINMGVASYMSTVTTPKNRTSRMAVMQASGLLGGMIGPFVSGGLLRAIGHGGIFGVCLFCNVMVLVYGFCFLKDVKAKKADTTTTPADAEERDPSSEKKKEKDPLGTDEEGVEAEGCFKKYFAFQHFKESITVIFQKRPPDIKRTLVLLVVVSATGSFASGSMSLLFLFVKDNPINMDTPTFNYYIGMTLGIIAFGSLLVYPLTRIFKVSDTLLGIVGTISRIGSHIFFAVSTKAWMIFTNPLIGMCGIFVGPATKSIVTKIIQEVELGKVFLNMAILDNICGAIGHMLFPAIYPHTRKLFSGMPFVISASILTIPLFILIWLHTRLPSIYAKLQTDKDEEEARAKAMEVEIDQIAKEKQLGCQDNNHLNC